MKTNNILKHTLTLIILLTFSLQTKAQRTFKDFQQTWLVQVYEIDSSGNDKRSSSRLFTNFKVNNEFDYYTVRIDSKTHQEVKSTIRTSQYLLSANKVTLYIDEDKFVWTYKIIDNYMIRFNAVEGLLYFAKTNFKY